MFSIANDVSIVLETKQADTVLSWHCLNAQTISNAETSLFSCFKKQMVKPPKQILYNVSGLAKPRELLAILGASGAGKTTLLNILTMRNRYNLAFTGDVYINNKVATTKIIAATSAYVQQDPLFLGTLTVKEQLIFQAELRIGESTYKEKLNRVEEVILQLGLSKCQNTLIGITGRLKGISGGEKKRLSIACEILTRPSILLCDEPTSGLDSKNAQSVVKVLRELALKGKTIICTIHQPSSEIYNLFHKILYLAEGRVAFLGTRDGLLNFFNDLNFRCPRNYNPADYFVHTLAVTAENAEEKQQEILDICNAFSKANYFTEIRNDIVSTLKDENLSDLKIKSRYKVPWFIQFRVVLWRSCLTVLKEPILLKMRFLQAVFIALLLGFFYFHQNLSQMSITNINGAMYYILITLSFQNLSAVVHVFCSELPIFLNEHSSGLYGPTVYFLSKVLADQIVFILTPFIFTCLSYWLIGFYPSIKAFFLASLIYILVTNCATSFGYFLSTISSSTQVALSFVHVCIVPLYLFGGFFIQKMTVPWYLKWLSNISWFEHGFEALIIIQWKDVTFIECNVDNTTCPKNGLEILESYDFNPNLFWANVIALIIIILVIQSAALLVIAFKSKTKSSV